MPNKFRKESESLQNIFRFIYLQIQIILSMFT